MDIGVQSDSSSDSSSSSSSSSDSDSESETSENESGIEDTNRVNQNGGLCSNNLTKK